MIDNISITGVTESIASLNRKYQHIKNLEPAYKKCSIYLDQWVQKNFKGQGDKVGKWQPFAASTLVSMAKHDPGRAPAKLLQKTGELRESFIPFHDIKKAGIGSALARAEWHNFGTDRLPARRLLPDSKEVRPHMEEIIDDHVKVGVTK